MDYVWTHFHHQKRTLFWRWVGLASRAKTIGRILFKLAVVRWNSCHHLGAHRTMQPIPLSSKEPERMTPSLQQVNKQLKLRLTIHGRGVWFIQLFWVEESNETLPDSVASKLPSDHCDDCERLLNCQRFFVSLSSRLSRGLVTLSGPSISHWAALSLGLPISVLLQLTSFADIISNWISKFQNATRLDLTFKFHNVQFPSNVKLRKNTFKMQEWFHQRCCLQLSPFTWQRLNTLLGESNSWSQQYQEFWVDHTNTTTIRRLQV